MLEQIPWLRKVLKRNVDKTLRAANGQSIEVIGRVLLPIVIDDRRFPFEFLVAKGITHSVLIGKDFLMLYKANIDPGNLLFQMTEVDEVDKVNSAPHSVVVMDNVELPPRSETVLPALAQITLGFETMGIVEPNRVLSERYHVCGAATLVKVDKPSMVPIQLPNPTAMPIQLFKNSMVGQFNPLKDEQLAFIDNTIVDWKEQINNFGKTEKCHYDSVLDFTAEFSFETSKIFNSLTRFIEIQDVLNQFSRFQGRELVGLNDLPESLTSALLSQLRKQRNFRFTAKALADGFPILMSPITQYDHKDTYISLHTLITLPRITTSTAFCTIEYLMPLTYQTNKRCYTGPLTRNDLILVSCPNSKIVMRSEALSRCFSQHGTLVCPDSITRHSQDNSWLGIPFMPGSTVDFQRSHVPAECQDTTNLYHLGGRYFLSTKEQQINLNGKPFKMMPLSVYHIPCDHVSDDLETGFGTCPHHLTVNLPVFRRKFMRFVPWTPSDDNSSTIDLHYKSLDVPPPLKFNKTVINALDKTFNRLDGDLAKKLKQVRTDINHIHEVSVTPLGIIIGSIALGFSTINLIILITLCRLQRYRRQNGPDANLVHYVKATNKEPEKIEELLELQHICPDCGGEPTQTTTQ